MKEYPGNRDYRLQDQDWSKVFHEKVGDFDFFSELEVECAALSSGKREHLIEPPFDEQTLSGYARWFDRYRCHHSSQ